MVRKSLVCFMLMPLVSQAMEVLDDTALSDVNGQAGITIEVSDPSLSINKASMKQDGVVLEASQIQRKSLAPGVSSTTTVDVESGRIKVKHNAKPSETSIAKVQIKGAQQDTNKSLGGTRAFYTLGANLNIRGGGASGVSGVSIDDSNLSVSNATLMYRDDGFDWLVKGFSFDTYLNQLYLDVVGGGDGTNIQLDINAKVGMKIDQMGLDLVKGDPSYAVTPESLDDRKDSAAGLGYAKNPNGFGSISMNNNLGGRLLIASGGQSGEGMTIRPNLTMSTVPNTTADFFQYKDDGVLAIRNAVVTMSSQSGLTFDLAQDDQGAYAQFAAKDLTLSNTLDDILIGDAAVVGDKRLGKIQLNASLADSGSQRNFMRLRAGGDAGLGDSGMTTDLSWNLSNGYMTYTDNNHSIWLDGLKASGQGTLTLDVTKSCAGGATAGCFSGIKDTDPNSGSYDGYFSGLRLGIKNLKTHMTVDDIRLGTNLTAVAGSNSAPKMIIDMTLNGQTTLQPGGYQGNGFTYNSDMFVTEGRLGLRLNSGGKGLWLNGLSFDGHTRDGKIDITKEGFEMRSGTYWSQLEMNDIRWGENDQGNSLGRIVLKRYEKDSMMAIRVGGSGAVCSGASGSNASACAAKGGRWEDRGNQGLNVKMKNILVRDTSIENTQNGVVTDAKRNQMLIESDRDNLAKNTGAQLVVDNMSTSDGDATNPASNQYGVQVEAGLDVVPTQVRVVANNANLANNTSIALNSRISFKEMSIDRIQGVHPTGGAATMVYGAKMQNGDIRANLSVTPLR